MYRLFLDDIREVNQAQPYLSMYQSGDWKIARTIEEFKYIILQHGIPEIISFDHDLGFFEGSNEITGLTCLRWLLDHIRENKLTPPTTMISHSFNPVGKENITKEIKYFYDIY